MKYLLVAMLLVLVAPAEASVSYEVAYETQTHVHETCDANVDININSVANAAQFTCAHLTVMRVIRPYTDGIPVTVDSNGTAVNCRLVNIHSSGDDVMLYFNCLPEAVHRR